MILKNKNIVITGGTGGLGKELALLFRKEGANVTVCSKDNKGLQEISENKIFSIVAVVTKEKDLTKLASWVVKKFGSIDIWVNNAGVWLPHDFAENFDMVKVKKMFEVNTFGTINGSRVALREMKKRGLGTVVNIISDSALTGRPTSSMYSSSKWAIRGFTKSIRDEIQGIEVIGIYPGGFKTEIFGKNKPEDFDNFMEVNYVAQKIIKNLKSKNPKKDLVINKL